MLASHVPASTNDLFPKCVIFLCECLISQYLSRSQAKEHKRMSGQTPPIHELHESVSVAYEQLRALPADSVLASARWASVNLHELELLMSDGHIEITKAEGAIVSEVSRARRLLKDHESRRNRLTQNTERTQLQLNLLAEAIAQNATVDGSGTPIDSSYIEQQVAIETRIARELIEALEETIDLAQRGVEVAQGARADNDSLQVILRARLARYILEGVNTSIPEDS